MEVKVTLKDLLTHKLDTVIGETNYPHSLFTIRDVLKLWWKYMRFVLVILSVMLFIVVLTFLMGPVATVLFTVLIASFVIAYFAMKDNI